MLKMRRSGANSSVTVPQEVCEAAGLRAGEDFVAVRAIGNCVVICRLESTIPDAALRAANAAMAAAAAEFARSVSLDRAPRLTQIQEQSKEEESTSLVLEGLNQGGAAPSPRRPSSF